MTSYEFPIGSGPTELTCKKLTADSWHFMAIVFSIPPVGPFYGAWTHTLLSSFDTYETCTGGETHLENYIGVGYNKQFANWEKLNFEPSNTLADYMSLFQEYWSEVQWSALSGNNFEWLRAGIRGQEYSPINLGAFKSGSYIGYVISENGYSYQQWIEMISANNEIGIPLRGDWIIGGPSKSNYLHGPLNFHGNQAFVMFNITDLADGRKAKVSFKCQEKDNLTPVFFELDLVFYMSGDGTQLLVDIVGTVNDENGLVETLNDNILQLNAVGMHYVNFLFSRGYWPTDTIELNKANMAITVMAENGVEMKKWKRHFMGINMNGFWQLETINSVRAVCEDQLSNDCSSEYNFGLNFVSVAKGGGQLFPEDSSVPSDLTSGVTAGELGDVKCFDLMGKWTVISHVYCSYCMPIKGWDSGQQKPIYQSQKYQECLGDASLIGGEYSNCLMGSTEEGCIKCQQGYSLNQALKERGGSSPTYCLADGTCDSNFAAAYLHNSVEMASGTTHYCNACPWSCTVGCDSNDNCVNDCSSEPYKTLTAAPSCECSANDCLACDATACDQCQTGHKLHYENQEGTLYNCLDMSSATPGNNCLDGHGLDLLASPEACRVCFNLNCPDCDSDYSACSVCIIGSAILDLNLHPINPTNSVSCELTSSVIPSFLYNPITDVFDPCPSNCLTCSSTTLCTECTEETILTPSGTCLVCVAPEYKLPSDTCGYPCRAPLFYEPDTSDCWDCSNDYDQISAQIPTFCSFLYDFGISDQSSGSSSSFEFTIFESLDQANIFEIEGEGLDALIENNFLITTEPTVEFTTSSQPDSKTIDFTFETERPTSISFALKNATLEETFISETSSLPLKVLKNTTVSFNLPQQDQGNPQNENQQNKEYEPSTPQEVLVKSGAFISFGAMLVGVTVVLPLSLANFDLTGTFFRSIQIISLFEKIRQINVDLSGSLLGYFLDQVSSLFDNEFLKKHDYEVVARPNYNKFYKSRISVLAYRRKPFNTILTIINFVVILWYKKEEKFLESLKEVSLNIFLVNLIEVTFYGARQLIHQDPKNLFKKAEYIVSFSFCLCSFFLTTKYSIKIFQISKLVILNKGMLRHTGMTSKRPFKSQNVKDRVRKTI
jgi:hypothetical protein